VSYLEFMSQGVNKGYGLQAAAEQLGLKPDEVMAVGDGHNDLPMLRWAGVSIAMGNASPEVKAASRFVTESCDRNGLALALDALIMKHMSDGLFDNAETH
jgi:Cof subfamily protein (haloacid dehalogenase superfamily)